MPISDKQEAEALKNKIRAKRGMAEKKAAITPEQYIKDTLYNLTNGIHVSQEGARALATAYD